MPQVGLGLFRKSCASSLHDFRDYTILYALSQRLGMYNKIAGCTRVYIYFARHSLLENKKIARLRIPTS